MGLILGTALSSFAKSDVPDVCWGSALSEGCLEQRFALRALAGLSLEHSGARR